MPRPLSRRCNYLTAAKLFAGQTRFANLAENVQDEFVRFLDARSGIAFDDKIDIGEAGSRSAITTEQRDRF